MTKKEYVFTLSRWHKIAQRVVREMQRLTERCNAEMNRSLSLTARGSTKVDIVDKMGTDVAGMMEQFNLLNQSLLEIRARLGRENVKHGISDQLAEISSLNGMCSFLRRLYEVESGKQHRFEDYQAMEPTVGTQDMIGRRHGGIDSVSIRIWDDAKLIEIEHRITKASRDIDKMNDQINNLNARESFALELPDAVADAAAVLET